MLHILYLLIASFVNSSNAIAITEFPTPALAPRAPATHTVEVGPRDNPVQFEPASVMADVGDVITFVFYPQNHSVVEADFMVPCVPSQKKNFFYSGIFDSFHEHNGNPVGNVSFTPMECF